MILVNGSNGIGTRCSTKIPNFNPWDIIRNLRHIMKNEEVEEMCPWYNGFIGSIVKTSQTTYTSIGKIEYKTKTSVLITELPIGIWTTSYKTNILNKLLQESKIEDYSDSCSEKCIEFLIFMSPEQSSNVNVTGLCKYFELESKISKRNMHLFDSTGVIKKYESPKEILLEFYAIRSEFYAKRKTYFISYLKAEIATLDNKISYIDKQNLKKFYKKKNKYQKLKELIQENGLNTDPIMLWLKTNRPKLSIRSCNEEEIRRAQAKDITEPDYGYLTEINPYHSSEEMSSKSKEDLNLKINELKALEEMSPHDLREIDLKIIEKELKVNYYENNSQIKFFVVS